MFSFIGELISTHVDSPKKMTQNTSGHKKAETASITSERKLQRKSQIVIRITVILGNRKNVFSHGNLPGYFCSLKTTLQLQGWPIKHGCFKTRFKTVLKHCFIFNKIQSDQRHVHVIDVDRQNEQFYKMSSENEELLLKNY